MIPDYPWFGPQHGGAWGWSPISWEGKVLSFAVVVACIATVIAFGRSRKTLYIVGAAVVFLVAVSAITGTAPG